MVIIGVICLLKIFPKYIIKENLCMKLRRWLALLSVCALLCGAFSMSVSAAADKYPLKNGDFESGNLDSWTAVKGVSASATAAYEGEYGCLITGDGDWDDLLSQTFAVLPGYTYTLSFWYKAIPMGVSWYLSEGEYDVRLQRGWAGNNTWTQVVLDFTPSADTVTLLFRGSGSHIAEKVYLDCVQVTLNPCAIHTYDNDCDPICNICDAQRTVGDHYYDHDCDIYCNSCGYEREASGNHTYDFPCATLCNYCGAPRIGEGEHTYDDACDVTCNFCGEIRVVPHFYDFACDPSCSRCGDIRTEIDEDAHTYDDIYDAECNLCDHVRIPTPKPMERLTAGGASYSPETENPSGGAGVSFRFFLEINGGRMNLDHSYVRYSASVERFNNGVGYKLVRVGAVMSNEKNPTLDLDHLTDRTIDVKAGYLCTMTEDSLSFVVRIVNIPEKGKNTLIQARPYYVYSDGKEEIVVYGETSVSQTYNGLVAGN